MAIVNQQTSVYPTNAYAVTPSDTTEFSPSTIYVGGTGDVTVLPADNAPGAVVTYKAVPTGEHLPVMVKRVMSTGTTATLMVRQS